MRKFGVRPEKEQQLTRRMHELNIREKDLEENFVHSGGSGGQNVNKTSTSVQLIHRPTGIVVKSQQERSQALNRFFARRLLIERIEKKLLGKTSPKELKIEKLRKQKLRRKRKTKKKLERSN